MANREMKYSGVEWIGEIPKLWKVMKFKYVMKKDKEIAKKYNNENVISLTKSGVIIRDLENPFGKMPASFDGYQHVEEGDLLLCLFDIDVTPRCVGIVKNNGVTSPAYSRYKLMDGFDINYYNYLLTYLDDEKILLSYTKSLRNTLTDEYFGAVSTIKPSLLEQKKIAAFLDEKVSHIENIIEDTKKSIENLKAYKQSLITETVTKGLNPNVEMKDSGIEWIGEIPNNWNTLKIKYSFYLKGRIGWQGLTSKEYQDEGPYLITGKDFDNGSINWESCTHISEKRFLEAPDIHLQNNDLLITKDGTIGKVAKVEKLGNKRASLNSGVLLIRNTTSSCDENYLYYVLLSNLFWKWYNIIKPSNSTILHLYQNDFKEFSYPLPSMEEQKEIARYLDEKTQNIDYLLYQKEQLITELNSYKKSLIYEYVTGKKEVK